MLISTPYAKSPLRYKKYKTCGVACYFKVDEISEDEVAATYRGQ